VSASASAPSGLIDVDRVGALDPADYWEPIEANLRGDMVLDPDEFYILVSRERVAIPPDHAAEMVPFNPLVGEFRVHYAGFSDPGFGYEPGKPPSARGPESVLPRSSLYPGAWADHRAADLRTVNRSAARRLLRRAWLQLSEPRLEALQALSRLVKPAPCEQFVTIVAKSPHDPCKEQRAKAKPLR
jgi:hypothetical protein